MRLHAGYPLCSARTAPADDALVMRLHDFTVFSCTFADSLTEHHGAIIVPCMQALFVGTEQAPTVGSTELATTFASNIRSAS
jgi:hypothetical protein